MQASIRYTQAILDLYKRRFSHDSQSDQKVLAMALVDLSIDFTRLLVESEILERRPAPPKVTAD